MTITRGDLLFNGEVLLARAHLFRTAKRAAWLGAWCGLGAALMCLMLIRWLENELGEPHRSPDSGAPTPAAAAPVRAPVERPPGPHAPRPRKQQPADADRRDTPQAGKTRLRPPLASATTSAGSDGRLDRRGSEPLSGR